MFIPVRCPRCGKAGLCEEVTGLCEIRLGKHLRIRLGGGRHKTSFKYRCGHCSYEGEYNDRAETLGRWLPMRPEIRSVEGRRCPVCNQAGLASSFHGWRPPGRCLTPRM